MEEVDRGAPVQRWQLPSTYLPKMLPRLLP